VAVGVMGVNVAVGGTAVGAAQAVIRMANIRKNGARRNKLRMDNPSRAARIFALRKSGSGISMVVFFISFACRKSTIFTGDSEQAPLFY